MIRAAGTNSRFVAVQQLADWKRRGKTIGDSGASQRFAIIFIAVCARFMGAGGINSEQIP